MVCAQVSGKTKLQVGFTSFFLFLLFAMAYNLGGSSQEAKADRLLAMSQKRLHVLRERIGQCQQMITRQKNEKRKEEKDYEDQRLSELSEATSTARTSGEMQLRANRELEADLRRCRGELSQDREEHTGTSEANATEVKLHMLNDIENLKVILRETNDTKADKRMRLMRIIRAYQLENSEMLAKLRQRQYIDEAALRKQNSGQTVLVPRGGPTIPFPDLTCPKYGRRYGLMFDAGSTGSRIHVFNFTYGTDGKVVLENEIFVQVKPGLSAYADNATAAAESLRSLMDVADKNVPLELQRCTPVELKATAGLRLLGAEKSGAILSAVERLFRQYNFSVEKNSAIVMDGSDEGPFAWATVNFLLGTITPDALQSAKTAAVFDMGGASTQVVFQPDEEMPQAVLGNHSFRMKLFKRYRTGYQYSHLRYGLMEARKGIVRGAGNTTAFACFPKGFNMTVDDVTAGNVDTQQDFDACQHSAARYLRKGADCPRTPCSFNGVWQPQLNATFSGPIFAFSYYYDRLEPFLPANETVTVGTIQEIGRKVCAADPAKADDPFAAQNKGPVCLDFAYLYSVLRVGYEVADSAELQVKKKINGVETAWALGAMLARM